jgi:RHS repeat-associated protein
MTGLNRYGDLAGTLSVANSSYTYDAVGRLTNLEYKRGVSTIASYGLVYDAANRITQSSGTDGTQNYTYDSTNQLTAANHTTITNEAYSYDANGNRTIAGYGTGTNNQLLTDGTFNYTYDDEGNRTKRTEIATGKVTSYVWDYRNRLATVLFKDGAGVVTKTIDYSYDVNNRRIGKRIDGAVSERYVYDGSNIALVFDGAGSQTHRYLYGTGVDTVLADERGGAVVWALADNQGTVRDVLDGNGVVLNHITYDSFGKVVSQSNTSFEFRYGYTGREQDNETGLDYYRARYYDAGVGRFIGEDPLGFGAGDGNLTRYVGNSPTNFTDPSGLRPLTADEELTMQRLDRLANQIEKQKQNDVPADVRATPQQKTYNSNFARDLRLATKDLRQWIKSVNGDDSVRLKATLYALNQWVSDPYRYGKDNYPPEVEGIRNFKPGDNKCSRFVGDVYARGGNLGYGNPGSLGKYPTRRSRYPLQNPYPISAEDLLSNHSVPGFPVTKNPRTGDIIAFPPEDNNPINSGHTGILLGRGIYISARHVNIIPGAGDDTYIPGNQFPDGVMVTRIPFGKYTTNPVTYRKFSPNE